MEYSGLLRLDFNDLSKGLYVAVVVVVLGALQQATMAHGLDFAAYDWGTILDVAWKAGVGYLGKNLLTDQTGQPLGLRRG